jgi:hypothetical protein
MQRTSGVVRLGMILALTLAMSGLGWSAGAWASDQTPDQAMRAFIDAVVRKDASAVLSFFPRTSTWQYVAYMIGTGKLHTVKTISGAEMRRDFAKKQGWYEEFFSEGPGYSFGGNFLDGKMWKKTGPATFGSRPSITWKQEGGKWVIEKITDTAN